MGVPERWAQWAYLRNQKFTARVTERSGVEFTLHDLRRAFIIVAESLDIPHYGLR